jgi:small subunit ribosomal protein S6
MKNSYETMFIVKPNLGKEELDNLFAHLKDAVTKNGGDIEEAIIWQEKKKLSFPINKTEEGIYYLIRFKIAPANVIKLKEIYKLNDGILRFLIVRLDEKQILAAKPV